MRRPLLRIGVLCAASSVLFAGAAAADTTSPTPPAITWVAPSPAPGTVLSAPAGSTVTFSVAAADSTPEAVVHVTATALPTGATLTAQDANPGTATVTWTPTAAQAGQTAITFGATDNATSPTVAAPFVVLVAVTVPPPPPPPPPPPVIPPPPPVTALTDAKVSHWAFVLRAVPARVAPSLGARVIARVPTMTGDGTSNILLLLAEQTVRHVKWVKVRLAILPNNSTGWVQRSALSRFTLLHTHLYIDRGLHLLVLKRDDKTVFSTHVGVGKPYWPTPAGQFYVRDKLVGFPNPFYGPIAFGTSARSAVLTDWPGGGYVGVHGTNEPQLIPGAISHGCVRLRNPDIIRLAAMMAVGTPLTVT